MSNFFNYANKIKNAIIKEKRAIASVNAKPKIAVLNKSAFKFGFLEIPYNNPANMIPIPIPAPANPVVANPAPIFCDACNNII